LAALVPVERLEQMRQFARRHALDFLEQQDATPLPDDEAAALGTEAKRVARQRAPKPLRQLK
jgi:hypothetical protein